MKSLIKTLISGAVKSDTAWSLLDASFIRVAEYAKATRRTIERRRQLGPTIEEEFISSLSSLDVRHGPFKGMRYPESRSVGSALVPKILGSYESELHPVIEKICSRAYDAIVDVGCAEGYYAVGLAMRVRSAIVFAYDTNRDAIHLCKAMGQLNNVADRVVTGAFCGPKTIRSIPLGQKALIISDCEGFERDLFDQDSVALLAPHDLLIELHDFIDIEISPTIRNLFQGTHEIQAIRSIDDIQKAHSYHYTELVNYDLSARKALLSEGRPAIMEWFYMTPKCEY